MRKETREQKYCIEFVKSRKSGELTEEVNIPFDRLDGMIRSIANRLTGDLGFAADAIDMNLLLLFREYLKEKGNPYPEPNSASYGDDGCTYTIVDGKLLACLLYHSVLTVTISSSDLTVAISATMPKAGTYTPCRGKENQYKYRYSSEADHLLSHLIIDYLKIVLKDKKTKASWFSEAGLVALWHDLERDGVVPVAPKEEKEE